VVGRIAGTVRIPEQSQGMVTAELAMAIPALGLVVAMLASVVGAASDLARASDAARSAARSASIGVDPSEVLDVASRVAPVGADVEITTDDGWVNVVVAVQPLQWGPLQISLPTVTGSAPLEPDLVGAGR
jgi:hypothetical protein